MLKKMATKALAGNIESRGVENRSRSLLGKPWHTDVIYARGGACVAQPKEHQRKAESIAFALLSLGMDQIGSTGIIIEDA